MSEDALAFVLRSDKLKLDEIEILDNVKEWASVNAVSHNHNVKIIICSYWLVMCKQVIQL